MRPVCCALLALFAVFSLPCSASAAETAASPTATGGDWPVYRGNAHSTGLAQNPLPTELKIVWEHKVENGAFEATPVVADGTVYLGDLDGNVFALDLTSGRPSWHKTLDTGFVSAAAVHTPVA